MTLSKREDDQQSEEEQQAVTTIQGPVEPEVNPEPEDPIPPKYHETPDDDDDYDHDYDYDQQETERSGQDLGQDNRRNINS